MSSPEFTSTFYESTQGFNFITRYLHSVRYKNLFRVAKSVSSDFGGKSFTVLDIGCGVCKVYDFLSQCGFNFNYIGVELLDDWCNVAESRYSSNSNFKLIRGSIESIVNDLPPCDLVVALESFEHIPGHIVFDTIRSLSFSSFRYLYATVPIELGPSLFLKNLGSSLMGYSRNTSSPYTIFDTFNATFCQLHKLPPHTTTHKGFDFRWLEHTLRLHMRVVYKTKSPFNFMPSWISPSIGFICIPY